jgi:signal transduction histidine kinase
MDEHNQKVFKILVADDEISILSVFDKIFSVKKTNYMMSSKIGGLKTKDSHRHASDQSAISFELVTCRQGDEAVDVVKRSLEQDRPFSVAFIDIRMPPGPDGVWAAEQIRGLDPDIEIVIITGYSDFHPQEIALLIPPVHKLLYIKKPLHRQEVVQVASALSSKWYTERELREFHKELEMRVHERTRELVSANYELQVEIAERKRVEDALRKSEEKLRESREQLRNFSRHLQSAREQERAGIAREIHDEFGQLLTVLKMDSDWLSKRLPKDQEPLLNKTKSMIRFIDASVKTIHRICSELRPPLLDDFGISAAMECHIQDFTERTGIEHRLTIVPRDITLSPELSTAIFRIFQEALINITRHAQAMMITVSLDRKDNEVTLTVADNGKGITPKQISDPTSFGLLGMRERARYYNGHVKITGAPEKGSTVMVSIPLPEPPGYSSEVLPPADGQGGETWDTTPQTVR